MQTTQPYVRAWARLMRIHQRMHAAGERHFKSIGINTAWFDVLAQLHGHEGVTQQELCEHLLVTKGNISQLLVKMEEAGLVRREVEGRRRNVWLTDEGRRIASASIVGQEQRIFESLSDLSASQLTTLVELLSAWERKSRSMT